MSSMVEATASALYAQLRRLDRLALDDMDKVRAECERATAVNNTCKNIVALGDLYMRSQMVQMDGPGSFVGGILFDGPKLDSPKPDDFGGRTKLNEHGEFVADDGLDAYTGSVEDPGRIGRTKKTPDEKREYDKYRQREYRDRKAAEEC